MAQQCNHIKGYPIYQIETHEPYPEQNGGQLIGALEVFSAQTVT